MCADGLLEELEVLEMLEVLYCVLLCMLEVPEVMRCVLLCLLEALEVLETLEVWSSGGALQACRCGGICLKRSGGVLQV